MTEQTLNFKFLLNQTFQLFKKLWLPLTIPAIVSLIPALSLFWFPSDNSVWIFSLVTLSYVSKILLMGIGTAAAVAVIEKNSFHWKDLFLTIKEKWWSFIIVDLLFVLPLLAMVLGFGMLAKLLHDYFISLFPFFLIFGLPILIFYSVRFTLNYSMCQPLVISENLRGLECLKRSKSLMYGFRGDLLWYGFFVAFLFQLPVFIEGFVKILYGWTYPTEITPLITFSWLPIFNTVFLYKIRKIKAERLEITQTVDG